MDGISTIKPIACFEVEKIIGISKSSGNVLNYQVQWAPTWINGMHLVGCDRLVEEFLRGQLGKEGAPESVTGDMLYDANNENKSHRELNKDQRHSAYPSNRELTNDEVNTRNTYNSDSRMKTGTDPGNKMAILENTLGNEDENCDVVIVKQEMVDDLHMGESEIGNSTHDSQLENDVCTVGNYENTDSAQIHGLTALEADNSTFVNIADNIGSSTSKGKHTSCDTSNFSNFTKKSNPGQSLKDIVLDISDDDAYCSRDIKRGNYIDKEQTSEDRIEVGNINFSENSHLHTLFPSKMTHFHNSNKFTHHYRALENDRNFLPLEDYKCNICGKAFRHKGNMQRHIRTAHSEKASRYTCHVCGKRCVQNMDLVRHMRKHTGEKPFWCTVCEKRFTRKATLVQHMSVHTKMY